MALCWRLSTQERGHYQLAIWPLEESKEAAVMTVGAEEEEESTRTVSVSWFCCRGCINMVVPTTVYALQMMQSTKYSIKCLDAIIS